MRRTVFGLLFALLQLILVVGLSELTLRLLRPHVALLNSLLYSPGFVTSFEKIETVEQLLAESTIGFIPYQDRCGFVMNSRGFRTPEYSHARAPGTFRVLVLGDSFAHASGCAPWNELWTTQLERKLARSLDRDVEVINLGIPGIGPGFELRLWQLEGRLTRPDLVVLAFFVGNDFTDEQAAALQPSTDRLLAGYSYSFRLGRNLLSLLRDRTTRASFLRSPPAGDGWAKGGFALERWAEEYDPMSPTFDEGTHLSITWQRMQLVHRERKAEFDRLFSQVAPILNRLFHEVRQTGATLLVMIIPDEYQVSDELFARALRRHGASEQQFERHAAQARTAEFLRESGIPFLDLLPGFREHGDEPPLYKLRDTHWNVRGNTLAADLLVAEVSRTVGR